MNIRIEKDSLGEVEVPAERYWGAQTERSRRNFPIGDQTMPVEAIRALALCKKAAARVNAALGVLDTDRAARIEAAADEILAGTLDDEFPLVVWQTGSGTQSNMNVNEVIAHRANERAGGRRGDTSPIHPNDHVNRSQSSNDVFPTAMHLAAVEAIDERVLPAVDRLRDTLAAKANAFADVVKIGRTHLQDAVPLTLGQEISAWVAQLEAARTAVVRTREPLCELALGGTAVGTGLNAPVGFAEDVAAELRALTGRPFVSAPNKFAALAAHDAFVGAHGALAQLAAAAYKIADDVRRLASGPRAGIGEILIPENEPGSSIMPGKVNPTQAEALTMVCARVLGNQTTVAFAATQGHFQLNVMKPVILHAFLESTRLLGDALDAFDTRCARGIEPDRAAIERHLRDSLMLVTALVPRLGYDTAARIARHAHTERTTLREAAAALGILPPEAFDRLVRPEDMTRPG